MSRTFLIVVCHLLLYFKSAYARFEGRSDDVAATALPNIELGVSAMVGGCVNAITGDYVESVTEFVIPGPEPFVFSRMHSTSDFLARHLYTGWRHNLSGVLVLRQAIGDPVSHLYATHIDHCGAMNRFSGTYRKSKTSKKWEKAEAFFTHDHFSNCSSGIISARTNPKNTVITHEDEESYTFHVKPATGILNEFVYDEDVKRAVITKEITPNQCVKEYQYLEYAGLKKVNLYGKNSKKPYASIELHYRHDAPQPHCEVKASDGRSVRYSLKKAEPRYEEKKAKLERYYMTKVTNPEAPTIEYEYQERLGEYPGALINKRILPDDRVREIGYITAPKEERFRHNRVEEIKAPLGHNKKLHLAYQFKYPCVGETVVSDAEDHITIYRYDRSHLLSIERCQGTSRKTYSTQRFLWGKDDLKDHLIGKVICNSDKEPLMVRSLEYDSYGNVIRDITYGQITGKSPKMVQKPADTPSADVDCYSIRYIYEEEGLFRLLEESHENGKRVLYSYAPEGDLLSAKHILLNDKIYQRQFFFYDKNGILNKRIIDNGSRAAWDNLEGVTECKIITYVNQEKAPIGLPIEVREFYFDLLQQKQVLLSKKVNSYSAYGQLQSQEVYDSMEAWRYKLTWEYDAHGNVVQETNALGQLIQRRYDANDNLIWECGPNPSRQTTHQYDFSNRLIMTQTTGDDGITTTQTYKYDWRGNRIEAIDSFGNSTCFGYDEHNRLTSTTYPKIHTMKGPLAPETVTKYNELDHPTCQIDALKQATFINNNIYGKPLVITYPDGTCLNNTYYLDGTLEKTVAGDGVITEYQNDPLGRVLSKTCKSNDGQVLACETYEYDAFHLIAQTDPEGVRTEFHYDPAGRLKELNKGSTKTLYSYDVMGQLSDIKEYYDQENYRLTKKCYDLLNRLTEETVHEGKSGQLLKQTKWIYDEDGNVISLQEGDTIRTTTYNSLGKPLEEKDPEGNITKYHYNYHAINVLGQEVLEISVTDPLGTQTITQYDSHARVYLIIKKDLFDKVLMKKKLFYSLTGYLELAKDTLFTPGENEREIQSYWERDFEHKLIRYIEARGTAEQKSLKIDYNGLGQKTVIYKPDGVKLLHSYDAKGRLLTITASDKSLAYQYSYDRSDHPIQIVNLLDNTTTTRSYDSQGRLKTERLANGLQVAYRYDLFDRPIETTLPDKSKVTYSYDASHLKQIERSGYSYHYNKHNLSGLVVETQLPAHCGTASYEYDDNNRLLSSSTHCYQQQLTYDAVGNLKSNTVKIANSEKAAQYQYDALYQLTEEKGWATHHYLYDSLHNCISKDGTPRKINALNQILSAGKVHYRYDLNGNRMESSEGITYQYDALDRLVQIITSREKWVYTYDSFHRRLSSQKWIKKTEAWEPQPQEQYIYQGDNEVGAYVEGKMKQLRILGIGKGAEIGATIAMELQGTPYVPTHDHNGNVVSLQKLSGKVAERYEYSAFGEEQIFNEDNILVGESQVGNPWRFSSKRTDSTKMVYFGRRYYEPHLGRWLTPDPLGYDAGSNLYAYVLNNPLTHIDLYGLFGMESFWSACGQFAYAAWDNVFSMPGRIIETIGQHMIPLPFVREVVSMCGTVLRGQNPLCNPTLHEISSRPFMVGNQNQLRPDTRIMSLNGANNTKNEAEASAQLTSNNLLGQFVNLFYNATQGFASDIRDAFVELLGIPTQTAGELYKNIQKNLDEIGPKGRLIIEAHSRSGASLGCALPMLSPEQRAQIEVYTFGSAKIIDREEYGLAAAKNYVNTRDPVPFITDPMGLARAYAKNDGTVEFLSGSWFDHSIGGATYLAARKSVDLDILDRFGKHR